MVQKEITERIAKLSQKVDELQANNSSPEVTAITSLIRNKLLDIAQNLNNPDSTKQTDLTIQAFNSLVTLINQLAKQKQELQTLHNQLNELKFNQQKNQDPPPTPPNRLELRQNQLKLLAGHNQDVAWWERELTLQKTSLDPLGYYWALGLDPEEMLQLSYKCDDKINKEIKSCREANWQRRKLIVQGLHELQTIPDITFSPVHQKIIHKIGRLILFNIPEYINLIKPRPNN